ncbi:D-arabinono-1,4-lactone oxidase [Actinokineospora bangkokensis]|uniref:FAD-binding protein n=1 Tax=Actinokineospora bangkokensis TaxID=1193682 RepID=A0A1Q9LKD1_9PSEU|nr:D-arabinono-1,4-lactone oxidase [Actinokineospora bangkokensis]OLR92488.1 FAD-binding protein [Actinokineospora bangkokensis]
MSTAQHPARNWAGNVTFGARAVHRPHTLDALREVVAESPRVRALGSGHSFSAVTDTTGDLVALDALPPLVEVSGSTATVGAGMTYGEVAARLHAEGVALGALASLPHISVAGSVATATHGSGTAHRCLAADVRAVHLLTPEGDLTTISRDTTPDTLPGAVVALGGLGVVTALTLDVEPTYEVAQDVLLDVPLDEVERDFAAVHTAASSVSTFTRWQDGTASVFLKNRVGHTGSGWRAGTPATTTVHPVPGMSTASSTQQLGVPGPWFERLPHFRPELKPSSAGAELQSEVYVPLAGAREAIGALRAIADVVAPVLQIAEIRTVAADDLWLSPAHRRDSLTIHFTWVHDTGAALPAVKAVEDALRPLGARPHWGKLTTMAPEEVVAHYPRAQDFTTLLRTMDPGGKFTNDLLDAHFPRG